MKFKFKKSPELEPDTLNETSEDTVVKKEKTNKKGILTNAERRRRLKYGSLSAVLTVIFVVVVVLVNVLVSLVAKRVPSLSLDTTNLQYYELSDETLDYLKTIKSYDITINFIGDRQTLMDDEYYNKILTLAEKYGQYAENIKVSCVDIDKNPAFSAKYQDFTLAVGDALVSCGNRTRQLSSVDFLSDVSSDSESGDTSETEKVYNLNAEYAITTGLMVVTASDNPAATVITGHGESELPKLVSLLENNGYAVGTQSIVKELDYNSNLLIIAAPTKDFSEDDLKKLDEFLFNDGKYGKSILYVADYTQPRLNNLEAFLGDWGYELSDGVVYESDSDKAYANMPYLNTLTFYDSTLTLTAALKEVTAYGYYGRPIKIKNVLDVNMTNTILLQHSETSKVGIAGDDGSFTKGEGDSYPYTALAMTHQSITNEKAEICTSNVIIANSLGFFGDQLFDREYSANPDIMIAAVDNALGRENKILLPTKSLSAASLGITYNQANIIGAVAAVVIPVLLLAVCLTVYIRRRFL